MNNEADTTMERRHRSGNGARAARLLAGCAYLMPLAALGRPVPERGLNEAVRLVWVLARLAFPRAREKKKKKQLGICECCSLIIAAARPARSTAARRGDEHSCSRYRLCILTAVHFLPAFLVVLARAPVAVPAGTALASVANGHARCVAARSACTWAWCGAWAWAWAWACWGKWALWSWCNFL
jgi:hypothetical protein